MDRLTNKQMRFVRGIAKGLNQSQAARDAGYANPDVAGSQQIRNPKILKELQQLTKRTDRKEIATIEKRKERLTQIMLDPESADADRCRAIDLLNKMEALYIIKNEVTAQLKLSPEEAERQAIEIYRDKPELWERIKAGVEGVEEAGDCVDSVDLQD